MSPAAGCGDAVGACGAVGQALTLDILVDGGTVPTKVRVGTALTLDETRTIWLTQAAKVAVATPSCPDGASELGTFMETVAVEELAP